MRRLSPTTHLVLASLVAAGQVTSSVADETFYFNDWITPFENLGYTIEPYQLQGQPGKDSAGDIATSIVNSSDLSGHSMVFTFTGLSVMSGSCQNAILVNADTRQTLAVGYNNTEQADTSITLPQFPVSWESATGSLTMSATVLQQVLGSIDDAVMYFQMGWEANNVDGYGYSPIWVAAKAESAASSIYSSLSSKSTTLAVSSSPLAVFAPMSTPFVPLSALTTSGSSTTAAGSTSAAATSAPTATSTSASTSSSGSATVQSKSSSPKALSTGALVGIIIGGVAVLALLILAAFLCIRKRRQRNSQQQHALLDRDTQDLMTEKEARAAGTAPDTPYSEEGHSNNLRGPSFGEGVIVGGGGGAGGSASQRGSVVYSSLRNVTTVGSGVGTGTEPSPTDTHPSVSLHDSESLYSHHLEDQQQQQQAFPPHRPTSQGTAADLVSPQSDEATERSPLAPPPPPPLAIGQEETRARAGSSATSRAATPGGGSSARFAARAETPGGKSISDYLHEDGMTADEIRRFEEEERALDEAIEQAGRTSSRTVEGR